MYLDAQFEVRVTELSLSSRRDILSVATAADINFGEERTHWFRGQTADGIDEDDIEKTPVNTMIFFASTINVTLMTRDRNLRFSPF